MQQSNWAPDEALFDRPNVARMWDYFLGGGHNFAVDRRAAEEVIRMYPDLPLVAQVTRAFLGRAVRFLVSQGIDQFLDIGAGIPTANSVHEIAQRLSPTARVAYVDNDPVAVAHSWAILRDVPNAVAVLADAREPRALVEHADVRRVLDWSQPIGVLAIAMFHFVPEDAEAHRIIHTIADAVPSGSYLVLTHASAERVADASEVEGLYTRTTAPFHFRSREGIADLFDGFEVIEPGIVYVPLWRPETEDDLLVDQPDRTSAYAGAGRKP